MIVIYKLLLVVVLLNFINSFKFTLHNNINYNNINNDYSINNKNRNSNSNHNDNKMVKKSLSSMIISLSLLSFPLMMNSLPADAIDKSTVTIYKSGKSPKQEDPNDPKKGTKKETSFLRCLSNCKADCQKPGGMFLLYVSNLFDILYTKIIIIIFL